MTLMGGVEFQQKSRSYNFGFFVVKLIIDLSTHVPK